MKKKILAIIIAIMAVSLTIALVGCDGSGNSNDGSGKPNITYTNISTVDELQAIANQSGNYKLANDINISGSSWTPIEGFSGLLEGDSHEIQGLNISGNKTNVGLFSTLKGTVQNLRMTSVNITGTGDAGTAGAVCGTNEGTIKNVTVSGTINTPYYNNVGGVVGISNNSNIANATNLITIEAFECVGGIAGYMQAASGTTIDNLSNEGVVNGKDNVGGIIGKILDTGTNRTVVTLSNSSNKKSISGSGNNVGGLVGCQTSKGYSSYPTEYAKLAISSCQNESVINGKDYVGGIIGYADYLQKISSSTNAANITGSNYVGGFVGKAAGSEISIATNSNQITGRGYVGGIAGYAGDIKNCTNNGIILSTSVIIEGSESCAYVGGIAGYANSINNSTNNIDITINHAGQYLGGIVGYLQSPSGTVNDSNINTGDITGYSYVGGIVGRLQNSGTRSKVVDFTNCENSGIISGTNDYIGGIIGFQSSNGYSSYPTEYAPVTISSCSNSATINGKDYTAGIIGYGNYVGRITSSMNTANITGANYVGGYIGKASGAAVNIATNNNVITGKGYVGGIAGYGGDLSNCTNNGDIISSSPIIEGSESCAYVGGIAGYATSINNCINNNDITVTHAGHYIGGIVGYLLCASGMVNDSNTNDGIIKGASYLGGIAGRVQNTGTRSKVVTFTNNINRKEIVGTGEYVGGIVGFQSSNGYSSYPTEYANISISNCENSGNISGSNYVAGILGYGTYAEKTEAVWATNTNSGTITGNNKGNMYGYLK